MPDVRIVTLGGIEIGSTAGRAVANTTRKTQALLVYLALAPGRPHPRSKLAAMLWQDSDESQARGSLRQALTSLRQAAGFGPEALATTADQVTLAPGAAEVDAIAFEAAAGGASLDDLEAAAACYRGDFLDGFDARAPGFEDWMLAERYRLHARAVDLLRRLRHRHAEAGDSDRAVVVALRLLALEPLEEEAHRALMRLYAGHGRAEAALRQFHICREVLARELAVQPQAETEALYREIRDRRRARPQPRIEASAAPADGPAQPPEAEIRQVTVLACEYADAPECADPERLHRRSDRLHRAIRAHAESHGGAIERLHDDGAIVVFGLSRAHTDDVERALRTALRLRDGTEWQDAGAHLALRAGIAAGRVLLSPSGDNRGAGLSGQALKLATLLAGLAAGGEILVAEDSWEPGLAARSAARPRALTRAGGDVLRAFSVERLAEGAVRRSPFIGRDGEFAQLAGALQGVRDRARGQIVLIRGEAGIGKTRLVEEFARAAEAQGFARHVGRVLDFGEARGAAAIPAVVGSLLRAVGDGATGIAAVERAIATGFVPADREAFLLHLMEEELPDRLKATFAALDVGTRQRLLLDTLAQVVRGAAAVRPALVVVEDLHWAGPATIELVGAIGAAIVGSAGVLVATTRSLADHSAAALRGAGGSILTVDLGPLYHEDATRLAERIAGAISPRVIGSVERAGGNPLFLEHLLRQEGTGADELPGSVQGVVQARMDELDEASRRVLKVASVLGQIVEPQALEAVLGRPAACERLVEEGLFRPVAEGLLFSHAVVAESAYLSLPGADRAALHRRAAAWFASRDPALRAAHLDRAEDPAAALAYLDAARAEARAYRHDGAIAHAERGLALAREPGERYALARHRTEWLLEKGAVAEAGRAFEALFALAPRDAERAEALLVSAAVKRLTDDLDGAFADLDRAGAITAPSGRREIAARIHLLRGNLLFPRGDLAGCLREHERALALARESGDTASEIAALGGLGDAEYMRGRMRSARDRFATCVELATREGLARVAAANRSMLALTHVFCGDTRLGLAEGRSAIADAARIGHLRAETIARHSAFLAQHALTEFEPAMDHAQAALDLALQLGAPRFEAEALCFRAELHRQARRNEEALADIERALSVARQTGMEYFGPGLLGTLARISDDPAVRAAALAEADAMLETNHLGHNHLLGRRDAIEACLDATDWNGVEHHAAALERFCPDEPAPWSSFFARRGRAIAGLHRTAADRSVRQELDDLAAEARTSGYLIALPALEAAMALLD